jgi:branched-chain amino acid aminotransferase
MSLKYMGKIWLNGRMIEADEARVSAATHGLHYGTGVFEGTRSYMTGRGPTLFRLDDHIDRWFASARVYGMEIPYSREQLIEATHEVVEHSGSLGIRAKNPLGAAILAWPWSNQHGDKGLKHGVRATVSPWRKFSSSMMPTTAKASGQYLNSRLAVDEAASRGFDEAILLNVEGDLAEASVANIFLVHDGRLITNDERSSILMGITRDTILELARDRRILTEVRRMNVEELFTADEIFLTGTASEVVPVREVDGARIGNGGRGEMTAELQAAYFAATHALDARREDWLDYAGQSAVMAAS